MSEHTLVACIGLQKTGKTHHLAWMLDEAQKQRPELRAIVVDANREWPKRTTPPAAPPARVLSVRGAVSVLEGNAYRTVYLSPGRGTDDLELAQELGEAVMGRGWLVVMPEVWRYMPLNKEPPAMKEIVRSSRHPEIAVTLWADLQHFFDVPTAFTSDGTLHLFGQTGSADKERIKKLITPDLVPFVEECARRAGASVGEPGWHVTVGPLDGRQPPFALRRTPA